ncbi:ARM repeat-containing protein [Schizopora paradoxa]|uniref:ARM repeat-containing protein n=1 Tax=Schizopora paradoxa TaxID=27342 RepID=A0A0H2S017_9AGAM|nr:ARM repeat-containing protein [Schizopora paradoxa]
MDHKIRGLLNKIVYESSASISSQIATLINECRSTDEALSLLVRLVCEHALDSSGFSGLYASLCQALTEKLQPEFVGDRVQSFRELLIDHCQTQFALLWNTGEDAAAITNETHQPIEGNPRMFSDEYYDVQKARRHRRGLVQFIGELYRHEVVEDKLVEDCTERLLKNNPPGEQEVESLCILFSVMGQFLEGKDPARLDAYFERMESIANMESVSPRISSLIQNVIELRQRNWVARGSGNAPPLPRS